MPEAAALGFGATANLHETRRPPYPAPSRTRWWPASGSPD